MAQGLTISTKRRSGLWTGAAALFALLGLVLVGQGLWIHAKALLAQVLLERAFEQTLATGAPVKPWPWADTWPVARIEFPRLGKSVIVLAGSSGQALAFGPGHVEGTPDAGRGRRRGLCRAPRHAFRLPARCRGRRRDRRHPHGRHVGPVPHERAATSCAGTAPGSTPLPAAGIWRWRPAGRSTRGPPGRCAMWWRRRRSDVHRCSILRGSLRRHLAG